jgi:hypothetical protein
MLEGNNVARVCAICPSVEDFRGGRCVCVEHPWPVLVEAMREERRIQLDDVVENEMGRSGRRVSVSVMWYDEGERGMLLLSDGRAC